MLGYSSLPCVAKLQFKMAQYNLVVYQQSKYKSKQTQNLITTNCEDMLRDVFCADEGRGVKVLSKVFFKGSCIFLKI